MTDTHAIDYVQGFHPNDHERGCLGYGIGCFIGCLLEVEIGNGEGKRR